MMSKREWGTAGRWLGLIAAGVALAACAAVTPTPVTSSPTVVTSTMTVVPATATASATATLTPQPTETPAPSATPGPTRRPTLTPSPMPSALPKKTILISFRDVGGGDGGWPYEEYLGTFLPGLLLYSDGQLLRRTGSWYSETTLTQFDMCTLLKRIEATGFTKLEEDVDVYEPGIAETIGDGAPTYSIFVNGSPPVGVYVSIVGMAHAIAPVAETYNLLKYYSGPGRYAPYVAEAAFVWVERGRGAEEWYPTYYDPPPAPTPPIDSWPADLPSLATLLPNDRNLPAYVQGNMARRLATLPKRLGLYRDQGQDYFVIVRPLLPNESGPNAVYSPNTPTPFQLPFTCN